MNSFMINTETNFMPEQLHVKTNDQVAVMQQLFGLACITKFCHFRGIDNSLRSEELVP